MICIPTEGGTQVQYQKERLGGFLLSPYKIMLPFSLLQDKTMPSIWMLFACTCQEDPKFTAEALSYYELQNTPECSMDQHFYLVFYQPHQQETSLHR